LDTVEIGHRASGLGPQGGASGGSIVAAGVPEAVAVCDASHTGRYLAAALRRI